MAPDLALPESRVADPATPRRRAGTSWRQATSPAGGVPRCARTPPAASSRSGSRSLETAPRVRGRPTAPTARTASYQRSSRTRRSTPRSVASPHSPPPRAGAPGHARGQARPRREGLHPQPRRCPRPRRGRGRGRGAADGGHVDAAPPGHGRGPRCSRTACSAEVHCVTADYGVRADRDPTHRLLDPALAGRSPDLGIYPLSFASVRRSGRPRRRASRRRARWPRPASTPRSALVGYGPGLQASLFTLMFTVTPHSAQVSGSPARIEVGQNFYLPTTVTLVHGERARGTTTGSTATAACASRPRRSPATDRGAHGVAVAEAGRDRHDPGDRRRDPPPARSRLPGRVIGSRGLLVASCVPTGRGTRKGDSPPGWN